MQRFVAGKLLRRSALPTADLSIRKLAAIEALSRHGAAQPGMLDSISIDPNLWPTSAVIDWLGILDRVKGVKQAAPARGGAHHPAFAPELSGHHHDVLERAA
ncbi:MAG: hypothetical protein U1F35_17700 [Steroidobacteraceae bacterium]